MPITIVPGDIRSISAFWIQSLPLCKCKQILGVQIEAHIPETVSNLREGVANFYRFDSKVGSIAQPDITQHGVGRGTCPDSWKTAVGCIQGPPVLHIIVTGGTLVVTSPIHIDMTAFLSASAPASLTDCLAADV